MRKLHRALSAPLLAIALSCMGGTAGAQESCLKVMTFDWSATLIIDPAQIVNNSDLLHANAAYEPLVVFDNDFQVHPWLAESFSASPDGTEWTFNLRKDVKFHDGADLTSADVVYTYRRLLDPATASPGASELGMVTPENIRADGPHKVIFKTSKPVAQLPLLLATKYALIVRDGSTTDDLKKNSNGTGPYVIKSFQADAPRSVLQKNESYWQPGKPQAPVLSSQAFRTR